MANKVLRSIYIEVEQLNRLKQLSETTKVPQAVYIREALDLVLEKYWHRRKLRSLGEKKARRKRQRPQGTSPALSKKAVERR